MQQQNITIKQFVIVIAFAVLLGAQNTSAQTGEFKYQGKLTIGANAANGNFNMQFRLFDSPTRAK